MSLMVSNSKVLTWREVLDMFDGAGLVITDYDEINDVLDNFDTNLDEPVTPLEVMSI